jgi:hypothetical protein
MWVWARFVWLRIELSGGFMYAGYLTFGMYRIVHKYLWKPRQ